MKRLLVTAVVCVVLMGSVEAAEVFLNESVSVVSGKFYGVNNHGTWASGYGSVDANGDGTYDTLSNGTWHRQKMLEARIGYLRADMNLGVAATSYPHFTGRVNTPKGMVKWAYENNITMLYIASYMPYYLANITSECSTYPSRCGPTDNQAFADLVVEWLDEVTLNGTYASVVEIELWNEPDLTGFWLPGVTNVTDPHRFDVYNAMYGPMYDAIKRRYPEMQVGGPGLASIKNDGGKQFALAWLSKYKEKQDFVSFHFYNDDEDMFDVELAAVFGNASMRCAEVNATCKRWLLDEFNEWTVGVKLNDSRRWAMQLSLAYAYMLNYNASKVSTVEYQWSESKKYVSGIGYPEYPQRWSMVSEPTLDNAVYESFNVTKRFSEQHPVGAEVLRVVNDDERVLLVASKAGGEYRLTMVNKQGGSIPYATEWGNGTLSPWEVKELRMAVEAELVPGNVTVNGSTNMTIVLIGGRGRPSALQFDVHMPGGVVCERVFAGARALEAEKIAQANCRYGEGVARVVVFGLNRNVMQDGELVLMQLGGGVENVSEVYIDGVVIADRDAMGVESKGGVGYVLPVLPVIVGEKDFSEVGELGGGIESEGYVKTYTMEELGVIAIDGIGTFFATIVENVELVVIAAVVGVGGYVVSKWNHG